MLSYMLAKFARETHKINHTMHNVQKIFINVKNNSLKWVDLEMASALNHSGLPMIDCIVIFVFFSVLFT